MRRPSEAPDVFSKLSFGFFIASWLCLATLLIGNRFSVGIISTIAMFASVFCVFFSSIFDVIASRGYRIGRGAWDWIAPVMMFIAAMFVVYGYLKPDYNMMASAVLCVFLFSFIPSVLDIIGVGRPHRYVEHRCVSSDSYSYPPDPLSMFGMDTPKTPPPIIIEKGEELDDEWVEYLGVSIPGTEQVEIEDDEIKVDVVDVVQEESSEDHAGNND